uniref:Alpha-1,3/1,6-mannosyltransferase ALG2 n=1 Tax=Ditylenchus dipsaci TaxID=166011 RepID=A0A915DG71_9BILA
MSFKSGNLFLLYKPLFLSLYIFGLIICVPASALIWFVRRKLFNESWDFIGTGKAVVAVPCSLLSSTRSSGTAVQTHFAAGGHRVVWLTTMIDEYWANEDFSGVDIHQVRVPLHPGDWFSQNVALGYHLILSGLTPDLIVVDHSASCVPMLKWRFPLCKVLFYCHFPQQLVTPSRLFLYRWYSQLISLIEARLYEKADVIMVNSKFTASQFQKLCQLFPRTRYMWSTLLPNDFLTSGRPISRLCRPVNDRYVFLSMNRFWPEKRLDIILEAAAILKKKGLNPEIKLAGSVMHTFQNREYITRCCNPIQCDSALYTPPLEHFGIVPIEALEQRRPVIIKEPCGKLLAEAMINHMQKGAWEALDYDKTYACQRERFERDFSLSGFGRRIDEALVKLFPKSVYSPVVVEPKRSVQPFWGISAILVMKHNKVIRSGMVETLAVDIPNRQAIGYNT